MSAEPVFVWLRPLADPRGGVRGPALHAVVWWGGGRQRIACWAYRPFHCPHRRGARYWQVRRRRAWGALAAQLPLLAAGG